MPLLPLLRKSRAGYLPRTIAIATALTVGSASLTAPSSAQEANNRLSPVRDAEIEELMRDYATPVLRAAGQEPTAVEIALVRDMSFNAFVANGRRIFINLGAIVESKTPNQLIGVLAHETGHIAGGHLAAMRQKMEEAQTRAIIAMLLGAAAVGAGAAAGAEGSTIAGGARAVATAPGEIVRRDLLSYVRSQEQAADQAAVTYLTKTGQSPKGMLEVFKGFADKSMFNARFIDPYAVTHPMPVERIALLERIANESPYLNAKDSDQLMKRHQMARAKIIGFMKPRDTVLRTYPPSDTSLPARYARAVASYRFGSIDGAQKEIDSLIATEPNNAYFWELKGQALLEAGRPKQAIEPLRRAAGLKPKAGLIRIMLGEAMVATGDDSQLDGAISQLRQATASENDSADAYRNLATAYGRKNQVAEADLASAQSAFYSGDLTTAKQLAARAKTRFSAGAPGWLRADDIVNYRAPKLK